MDTKYVVKNSISNKFNNNNILIYKNIKHLTINQQNYINNSTPPPPPLHPITTELPSTAKHVTNSIHSNAWIHRIDVTFPSSVYPNTLESVQLQMYTVIYTEPNTFKINCLL